MESDAARQHRCRDGLLAALSEPQRNDARKIFDIAWPLHSQLLSAEGAWTPGAMKEHMWRLVGIRMQSNGLDPVAHRKTLMDVVDRVLNFK